MPGGVLPLVLAGWAVIGAVRGMWERVEGCRLKVEGCGLAVPTVDRAVYRGETTTAAALRSEGEHVRVYWPNDPEHADRVHDAEYRVRFDYLTFDDFGPHDAVYWRGMREAQLPNAGMVDGVPGANHFDPLLVERYADLLEAAVEAPGLLRAMGATHVATDRSWPDGERVHSSGPVRFYGLPNAPGRAWIVPEGRRVAAEDTLEAVANPAFDPGVEVVLDVEPPLDSPSQGTSGDWQILSLQDAPNAVTIRASLEAPGTLVLADTWYPGWEATVDGERAELLRANHAFRAVKLDEGSHAIEMAYRPRCVILGRWVSLTTLVVVTVGFLASGALRRG